jgi:hypothetical protein
VHKEGADGLFLRIGRSDEEDHDEARKGTRVDTNRRTGRALLAVGAALLMAALFAAAAFAVDNTSFKMVRSQSAIDNDCLKNARANVTIRTVGGIQVMNVALRGMPKNNAFALWVLQEPNAPFGVSWYQGDIDTDGQGRGSTRVVGIFSEETHAFSPDRLPAPQVDAPDAARGPKFAPVHTFHLGVWFSEPRQATAAGCSNTVTPFDGDHVAGIQALSTRTFPELSGPLRRIK